MSKECNELFNQLFWLSDEKRYMEKFVEAMIEWVEDWNNGDIRICLIDLHELNHKFPQNALYIAYDDCCGCTNEHIYSTAEFIEYTKDTYNEYAETLDIEEYWVNKIKDILIKN